jgi:RHH-type transcriptional regulator, proline utilization regulon repressor / proline dehydrogenase / delta 1-pyrroline-5-carboxylate dehydrogenase
MRAMRIPEHEPMIDRTAKSMPTADKANQDVEMTTHKWGEKLFELLERAGEPSLFTIKGLYGALMDWAMKDEKFKIQLFRFIDVLPTLRSSGEVSRHLTEYLDNDEMKLNPALRTALKATSFAGGLLGGGIKAQVTHMARMFMLGDDQKEIASILKRLNDNDAAFTVDLLGEAVVSEKEADEYAARYLEMLELLGRETTRWKSCSSNAAPQGEVPRLNISLKISAFYSQIHPTNPEQAIAKLSDRLRPVLRRARELGALINFDMESYAYKNLTLDLFKHIFSEPEFVDEPECGLAMQAYLRDTEQDLRDIVEWARARHRRITVRLVKGAYWDYETVIARQRGWPVPVFEHKVESDANFEKLSAYLLQNMDAVSPAFASHNIRSLAHVFAYAETLGLDRRSFEFQVLYGMADAIRDALLQAGCRVRVYCPVGELLPGMAYLVRRLLENTSNEGFLANRFAKGASREVLLRNPTELVNESKDEPSPVPPEPRTDGVPDFRNEPPTDFTLAAERVKMHEVLAQVRANLGRKHPLVIGGKRIETADWAPSLNPANQNEVIGYSARADILHADAALAAARAAQQKWSRLSAAQRAEKLSTLGDLLHREKAMLTALMVLEAGKNWTESDADVAEAIDFCHFNAAVARELGRPKRTQRIPGESNSQQWWPRGVGVVIAPWNFPLAILTGMMSAAVVTGNAVIVKPSDQTTVLAAQLVELAMEAGFPEGVINLLTGRGSVIGSYLGAHPQINFIAFTGSMEVGCQIWETAGRTLPGQTGLKRVICEMGGKNALIIDSDADLDEAVAGTVQSAFGYNGQKCSALSRLIVLEENYDKFIERLLAAAASLRVGPPEEPGNIIGPVIDRVSQERILSVIETGKTEAKLAWQGAVPNVPAGCYVPPAIFTHVPRTSALFRNEIFGPVLSVTRARSFDEALDLANDCAFALTGGLYSRSPEHIERVKAEMVCGNLYINRGITGAIVGRQPFGGFKMSGGGTKAGGIEYLQQYMVPRVITENCLRRGFAPLEED